MVFVEEKSDLILVSYVKNIKLTKLKNFAVIPWPMLNNG